MIGARRGIWRWNWVAGTLVFLLMAMLGACSGNNAGPSAGGSAVAKAGSAQSVPASDQNLNNPLAELHFRNLGPQGNRASAIAGVPGNPLVMYIGAASGGIWKTTDGGTTWKPIFDHEDVSSIGALAVAAGPQHGAYNTVWAGTGEPWFIRADHSMGDGVYKSTDAGRTWTNTGLRKSGHISRIVVDPHNSNRVFACAVGQAYRPQQQRGVFRTTDGGKTWKQVLFVNKNTGCSDLAIDPHNPNTLFAGMWQISIHPWDLDSGGPSGGVYVTHDGGNTWTKIAGHGLPAANHPVGKIAVGIAPSNPNRVYALIQDNPPGFYRSDNGGKTWTLVVHNYHLDDRFPYYTRFGISPDNENLLYFLSTAWSISRDGGKTVVKNATRPGGDLHDIWMDPLNPEHFAVTDDGTGAITMNGGKTYQAIVLPIAQIYHVYTDNQIPYNVYGNRQDGPAYRGPSNTMAAPSFFGTSITAGYWEMMGGCESAFTVPDPVDNNIVWATCYDGDITRMNLKDGMARFVSPWPAPGYGRPPAEMKYRWDWTMPIVISPEDHNRVYVGSQNVWMTTNGGQSWKVISPDLTLNDKAHEQNSGGITTDDLMTFDSEVLYSLAESPIKAGVIWAGSKDGLVHVTRDGGAHWTNVTKNIPNLPPLGMVSNIEPSHFAAGTAYITVDRQQMGDYNPYVYKTTDYGQTWTSISSGIPHSVLSFAHCVIEDPVRKNVLYLGTDNALYVSWDDGAHWTHLRNNLPPAPVYWLTVQKTFNDLDIATYGRGIYVLDDITPLQEWNTAKASSVYLFKPRRTYRLPQLQMTRDSERGSHIKGENPPYGADLNFYLRQPGLAELTILDSSGHTVRTLKVKGRAGLNRVWWNLEYEPAHQLRLLTSPPGMPWVKVGPKGYRPYVGWATFHAAPIVAPGTYTVRLNANGKQLTQPLVLLRWPKSPGTDQTIQAEVRFARQVLGELNEVVGMVNNIEKVRKQTEDLEQKLGEQHGSGSAAVTAARNFERSAVALESKLVQLDLTGAGYKESFREPIQFYGKLCNMLAMLQGDNSGGESGSAADQPPTDQQVQIHKEYQQELAGYRRAYQQFTQKTVPAFNADLKANHVSEQIQP